MAQVVFILGAGSNWAYSFPLGEELKSQVVRTATDGFYQNLQVQFSQRELTAFTDALGYNPKSIDSLVNSVPTYGKFAKPAIASCIWKSERLRPLYNQEYPEHYDPNGLRQEQDWYRSLYEWYSGKRIKIGNLDNLSFITFNYDRSLEFYLFNTYIQEFSSDEHNYFSNTPWLKRKLKEASPNVIHAYGHLGRVAVNQDDWNSGGCEPYYEDPRIDINGYNKSEIIRRMSSNLNLIHDKRDKSDQIEVIRETLDRAHFWAFIGYGFDRFNNNLLGLSKLRGSKGIYATSYGLTNRRKREIQKQTNIDLDHENCKFKNGYELINYSDVMFHI